MLSNPVNWLTLCTIVCLVEPVPALHLSHILEFFRYKYDHECTYSNIRPDGLIITNASQGLVFYQNKVWKTNSWHIADPTYERLERAYPQLNQFDSIDSVFTLLDRHRNVMYCFIIQESTYFLYFTQQTAPSLKHDPFTNQVYLRKGKLSWLMLASNYANLFINPIFCAMTLPVQKDRVIFFFFGYYTKYTSCEARMKLQKLDENKTSTLTNLYPIFILTKECEVFRQGQKHSNDRQECRFMAARLLPSGPNSSGNQNLVVLGQRTSLYFNYNLTHENLFKEVFKHRTNYQWIWDCKEISYRDYNTIKFTVLPIFTAFTVGFILFNSLLGGRQETAKKRFQKAKRIHRMHQKIRADYLKRRSATD